MGNFCKGKEAYKDSVNDDLESFFQDLQLGKNISLFNITYFLPKLTKEELILVETKDEKYRKTFSLNLIDVDETKMMMSESKSKFVAGFCLRDTFKIYN